MRYSRQREAIKEIIKNTDSHPDADWVYKEAAKSIPNISLGTVYRNLKELVMNGEVVTLETEDNIVHYDGDTSCHFHFICRMCGEISDIKISDKLAEKLGEYGFVVEQEKHILYGKCPRCAQNTLQ